MWTRIARLFRRAPQPKAVRPERPEIDQVDLICRIKFPCC